MFDVEFVAMKVGLETLHAIWYKLRIMGAPISGPIKIYGDDISVIHNTSKLKSILKKKCDAITYQAAHGSMTMRESWARHIRSEDDPANLLTKVVTRQKSKHLVSLVLYDIYDVDT